LSPVCVKRGWIASGVGWGLVGIELESSWNPDAKPNQWPCNASMLMGSLASGMCKWTSGGAKPHVSLCRQIAFMVRLKYICVLDRYITRARVEHEASGYCCCYCRRTNPSLSVAMHYLIAAALACACVVLLRRRKGGSHLNSAE
jgi:hypothetical protein